MNKDPEAKDNAGSSSDLTPGIDYEINEKGFWVFTASYLLRRGYCCQNGCLHCPYGFRKPGHSTE
jgi:hypothetical protein